MFEFEVKKNKIICTQKQLITSNSIQSIPVSFKFSSDWDGLARYAVFRIRGQESVSAPWTDNTHTKCYIPWECCSDENIGKTLEIGCYGAKANDTVILPTIWAEAGPVREGTSESEQSQNSPTPDALSAHSTYQVIDHPDGSVTGSKIADGAVTLEKFSQAVKSIFQSFADHILSTANPHYVTKQQIGLGNAENTKDCDKNVNSALKLTNTRKINGIDFDGSQDISICDNTKVPLSQKGAPNGIATLDANAKISHEQIPALENSSVTTAKIAAKAIDISKLSDTVMNLINGACGITITSISDLENLVDYFEKYPVIRFEKAGSGAYPFSKAIILNIGRHEHLGIVNQIAFECTTDEPTYWNTYTRSRICYTDESQQWTYDGPEWREQTFADVDLSYISPYGVDVIHSAAEAAISANTVQTTGQSEDAIMSQKAITNALNEKADRIPKTWQDVQAIVRSGNTRQYFNIGDQFIVEKFISISARISGSTGITAASVNSNTFITCCGGVKGGIYIFSYDGENWKYDNKTVFLALYGITVTGTPITGDKITVTEVTNEYIFDVIGIDHDTPTDTNLTHSMTLQMHDSFGSAVAFDNSEAAFFVDSDVYPDGLDAGTYHFTWNYATGIMVVGTYQFTLTQRVPVGGQIVIGTNSSSRALIDCKITTYATAGSTTAIESNVAITSGSDGTNLGTIETSSATSTVNSAQRIMWGSNNWSESCIRQWLNTANAANTWWEAKSSFDRPTNASSAGFLKDFDPAFIYVLADVSKKTQLSITDGYGLKESSEKVFLLSRTEIYAGAERSTDGEDGTVYEWYGDKYSDLTTPGVGDDSNRIKLRNGSATYWWLRTPLSVNGYGVRSVHPSGDLSDYTAYGSCGAVPACVIA